MYIKAIKTHIIEQNDTLEDLLDSYMTNLSEEDILVITSKIISVLQGRKIDKNLIDKQSLIQQESDLWLEPDKEYAHQVCLTIKNNILIPSAGVDESNSNDQYIIYPNNIPQVATNIWQHLKDRFNLSKIGVLITDSHSTILRRGVIGIALGWCGFKPLYSYINRPDIYDRPLQITQVNLLDSLAAAAVLVMGEGNEQTPFAIIKDAPRLNFVDRPPSLEEQKSLIIKMEDDLYAPLLCSVKWMDHS